MTDHERYRELAAGFVLGALDPDERAGFEAHVAECEACRREVARFAPIPGLLSGAGPAEPEPLPGAVVERAARRAGSEWAELSRSRRLWRNLAGLAAAVALVVGIAALWPRGEADRDVVVLVVPPGAVTGEVTLDARAWGTAVHLELAGLPQWDQYVAWVVDEAGAWEQAATWGPTPAGIALLDGASSIPADLVAAVVVTDADRTETLLTAAAG